jgi:AraC-like DNA-binding protein
MRQARDEESFIRAPAGQWILAGQTVLIWAHSSSLVGAKAWGRPSEEDARRVERIFFGGLQALDLRFDALMDGSAVEVIDPAPLLVFMQSIRDHFTELERRLRQRVGVISGTMEGVTLSGIGPALGGPGPVRILRDAREGFRWLLPDGGDALSDEVDKIASRVRGISPLIHRLRPLLLESEGRLPIDQAAHRLGLSTRTLQRELQAAGRTYRQEQAEARFRLAEQLLLGDDKIAAVAARLGLTEAGLTGLVRAHTGLTPSELRRRLK